MVAPNGKNSSARLRKRAARSGHEMLRDRITSMIRTGMSESWGKYRYLLAAPDCGASVPRASIPPDRKDSDVVKKNTDFIGILSLAHASGSCTSFVFQQRSGCPENVDGLLDLGRDHCSSVPECPDLDGIQRLNGSSQRNWAINSTTFTQHSFHIVSLIPHPNHPHKWSVKKQPRSPPASSSSIPHKPPQLLTAHL